ncbi:uncharacterized protein AMSG_06675 [Thecamonas trahens ATCC 50062]|uniref:Uncharacterized protein n=1 Tax=Thecamonas trahens ATCC 50062 TaxID=461836 RepID=A0A0L0DHI7_THETB|nr:hypothetical protein AMSG_06675 [Thecamonas trahens ATCC 50062]KNC50778.1 hypothetical protein AMSG_06675 [Thecamonas trahens ATCC 50062]|eukprot:XP_013756737.1 hypothetical protein AMSG_06675 [Thecamonas trahens ATCC 50062]
MLAASVDAAGSAAEGADVAIAASALAAPALAAMATAMPEASDAVDKAGGAVDTVADKTHRLAFTGRDARATVENGLLIGLALLPGAEAMLAQALAASVPARAVVVAEKAAAVV